jgi:hypothetical protein
MKPRACFKYLRADEVAETWDGVSAEIYSALWNKVVPCQKEIPNLEDTGSGDHVGYQCLAGHWDKLTESEQEELNALADLHDLYNEYVYTVSLPGLKMVIPLSFKEWRNETKPRFNQKLNRKARFFVNVTINTLHDEEDVTLMVSSLNEIPKAIRQDWTSLVIVVSRR